MTTPEVQFERELEIFRTEAEGGTQFLYAYLAVHALAARRKAVHRLLNDAPLFWNTCLAALQTASFMALGRIFDHDSDHNLSKLLQITQDHPEIFSKVALGRRKQGNSPEPPTWLPSYLKGERSVFRRNTGSWPTLDDFFDMRRTRAPHPTRFSLGARQRACTWGL